MGRRLHTLDSLKVKENINTQGLKMKIITYRNCTDCDIEFEDGTIVKNTSYSLFAKGSLKNPNHKASSFLGNERVGRVSTNNKGQKMTIISYEDCENVIVEFEDKTTKVCSYNNFMNGFVSKTNKHKAAERIGIKRTVNGDTYEIIQYNNAVDIRVKRLSDGKVFSSTYDKFLKSEVPVIFNPHGKIKWVEHLDDININAKSKRKLDKRVGETVIRNGYTFKIVDYINTNNVIVQCVENSLYLRTTYYRFINHQFNMKFDKNTVTRRKKRVDHTGEIVTKRNGDVMTIIAFRGCRDFDVQFSDGTIVTAKLYTDFLRGTIKNPNNTKKGRYE